jgi:hypothetical protein
MSGQKCSCPKCSAELPSHSESKAQGIPNTNELRGYIHCGMCLKENAGPQMLEIGWTKLGLQIWCRRHNANVMHIDFQGQKHPANTSRQVPQGPQSPSN